MKKLWSAQAVVMLVVMALFGYKFPTGLPPAPPCGTYLGTVIDSMDTIDIPLGLTGWAVGSGNGGAVGTPVLVSGYLSGQAIQMPYSLGGKGAWVQLRRNFPANAQLNLSAGDHLRFLHHGTQPNSIEVGLVWLDNQNIEHNYFASAWSKATHVPWWTYATWDFKDFRLNGQPFPDFSKVKAIFISVKNAVADDVGGAGSFTIDELQILNIGSRTVPASPDTITVNSTVINKAADWIAARQQTSKLLQSWPEESQLTSPYVPKYFAWLYDQALGLLVLVDRRLPNDLLQARDLATKLHQLQNADGSWYAGYDYRGSTPAVTSNKDIGPIAWLVYALMRYYAQETDTAKANDAYLDARQAAAWMATRQRADGSLSDITEWNLDAWWAFQITGYQIQANRVRDYLLNQVWDNAMGRFKSSATNHQIFLDNQTWGAPFLQALDRAADARRALSYAHANLVTTSSDGNTCGLDGAGPFAPWNEGTAQYVAQRGANSQYYWDELVSQQALDGGMPNSPDPVNPPPLPPPNNCPTPPDVNFCAHISWLSRWHGIAPTAWLYFAGTGGPFPQTPPPPITATPARNYFTSQPVTLTWNRVTGATGYEIQVDSSPTFTIPLNYSNTVSATTLFVNVSGLSNGVYYWRVRAKTGSTLSAWSAVESFILNA